MPLSSPPEELSMREAVTRGIEEIERAFSARLDRSALRLLSWPVLGPIARGTCIALTGPLVCTRALVTPLLAAGAERAGAPMPFLVQVNDAEQAVGLVLRILSHGARLPVATLRNADIGRDDWVPLAKAGGATSELPVAFTWPRRTRKASIARVNDLRAQHQRVLVCCAAPPSSALARASIACIAVCPDNASVPAFTDIHLDASSFPDVVIFDARLDAPLRITCTFNGNHLLPPGHAGTAGEIEAARADHERAAMARLLRESEAFGEDEADEDHLGTRPPAEPEDR